MSGYVFRTVVENPAHPEYGAVSLPFPIPNEKYNHIIEELLPPMQIGDPIKQDCVVKEVDAGCWPALKALEGQTVNVDELDYLAKRLDSFSMGEDAQYQGMAHKLGLTDIKDLINLTFCCQRVTVIDNFRELEKAGKDHLMNLNGGMMSMDEYEKADGQAIAKELIRSGCGQITPYGVVYDNGMEGLLTSILLLVAEFLTDTDKDGKPCYKRHIVSVFKLVQELLAPSQVKGKNQFQLLVDRLPPDHKARWFAGAALNSADQAMASVLSTVLSRLNTFLDSEMEQLLCFDTAIDAERFCNEKSAIFTSNLYTIH